MNREQIFQAVVDYRRARAERTKLEAQVAPLQKKLEQTRTQEDALQKQVPDILAERGLDTNKPLSTPSKAQINKLLSKPCILRLINKDLPVASASLSVVGKSVELSIQFSKPIFYGWETKTPYVSYSSGSMSLETPPKPTKTSIPRYTTESKWNIDLAYWDYNDKELSLWLFTGHRLTFVLDSDIAEQLQQNRGGKVGSTKEHTNFCDSCKYVRPATLYAKPVTARNKKAKDAEEKKLRHLCRDCWKLADEGKI